jgi:hypothetical protein
MPSLASEPGLASALVPPSQDFIVILDGLLSAAAG